MNKTEKKMIQAYWKESGGTLIEDFFIATTENGEAITADAIILLPDGLKRDSRDKEVLGREAIIIYAVEGSPSVSLIGMATIGAVLLEKNHGAKATLIVILSTKEDHTISKFMENNPSIRLVVYDPKELSLSRTENEVSLGERSFRFICNIEPLRDYVTGQIREFYPDQEYRGTAPLHKYGKGPFCVFTIPITVSGANGIYAVVGENEVLYVGATDDLYDKFHFQYGHIQPRDCYSGGHPEQCRMNHLVMSEVKEGKSLKLYFLETREKDALQMDLVRTLKPKWNIHGKRAPRQRFPLDVGGLTGFITGEWALRGLVPGRRYKDLTEHLRNVDSDEITLKYEEIEDIIQRKLPPSAYKYLAWWSNGNRTQAVAWLAAGWRIKGVDLGNSVVFRRVDK